MKISKRQLRRMIHEEKRLLTETMTEWEDYPQIADYVWGDVRITMVNMIDELVAPTVHLRPDDIDDVVTNALLGAMADIANQLGISPGMGPQAGRTRK